MTEAQIALFLPVKYMFVLTEAHIALFLPVKYMFVLTEAQIRLGHCGIVDAVVSYLSAIVASSSCWPEIRDLLASNTTWTIVRQGLIQV